MKILLTVAITMLVSGLSLADGGWENPPQPQPLPSQDSNHGPFDTMKSLYESTQTPVTVDDFTAFPGTDRWNCWIDSAYDSSGTQIQTIYLGTLDQQVNGGPLFPNSRVLVIGANQNISPDPSLSHWVKNTCSGTDLTVQQIISSDTDVRANVRKTDTYIVGHYFYENPRQSVEAYFYCAAPSPNTQR